MARAVKMSKSLRAVHFGGNPLDTNGATRLITGTCNSKYRLRYVGMRHLWITKDALAVRTLFYPKFDH